MAADLLTTIRSELDARLSELRPLLSEYERLLAAVAALDVAHSAPRSSERAQPTPRATRAAASPAVPARRRGRPRGSAAGALQRAASELGTSSPAANPAPQVESPPKRSSRRSAPNGAPKRERAPRGAARQAIVAALEHGSHTVGELVMVTAMTGPNININIRRMLAEGLIAKTARDGKTAYALPSSASGS